MPLTPAHPAAGPAVGAGLPVSLYRRLAALCPAWAFDLSAPSAPGAPTGPDWTDGTGLAARPGDLDAFLDGERARILSRYGHTARPDVAASRALHGYLWSVCLLMSGPWYLQRRVPRIDPRHVRVGLATGTYGIAPGASFACLPDDPAAGLRGVRVRTDEDALRDELRTVVADHVRPLLAALGPRLRRGPRALWGMVGDDLVSGIWHLGRALDEEDRAVRMAGELLPGPVAPFPGGADFRRLANPLGGAPHLTRTRLGCCLHYTVRPAETCATCPRLCGAEPVPGAGRDVGRDPDRLPDRSQAAEVLRGAGRRSGTDRLLGPVP